MTRAFLLAAVLLAGGSPVAGRDPAPPPRVPAPERSARIASSRAIAHYLKAKLLEQAGDREGAVAALRLAAAHDPQSPEIQVALAEALSRAGRGDEAEERAREAVALGPGTRAASEAFAVVGRLRAARGDILEATAALESSLGVQRTLASLGVPPDPAPWLLLGELKLASGDEKAALAVFEELSQRTPGQGSGFRLVGMLHEDRGDLTGAERWLERALQADPTDSEARRRLAHVHESLRRFPEARDDLVALLRFDPDDEESLVALGRLALRSDDVAGAREWFARLRRSASDPADAALRMALVWLDAGFPEEGLAAARTAEGEVGPRPRVRFAEGIALQELHRYREAIAALRQVPPEAGELYLLARDSMAQALSREGNHAEAERALEPALAAHPGDARLVARRAWVLQRAGRVADAVAVLERALADRERAGAAPDAAGEEELWPALGEALDWAGRAADAVTALSRAASTRPRDVGLLYALGAAYERAGQPEAALAQMRAILAIDPENVGAMNFIGYSLAERGERLDEAESLVRRALEARPRSAGFLDSLGWIAFQRGEYARAVEALERAARIAGPDPVILDHLADAYRALRRPVDAEGAWRRALRCVDDQSPAEAAKLRASIERKLRGGAAATAPTRAP
jgi:tetratricopeptide (TPR) repeat protein